MTTFVPFPKIPRLRREIAITEKIDGTNAGIYVSDALDLPLGRRSDDGVVIETPPSSDRPDGWRYFVQAASRTRLITPEADNFGFARWVYGNAALLAARLGEGLHHGEWWGVGIQRTYNLTERRFSLFNTRRWKGLVPGAWPELPNVSAVPVLYEGIMADDAVDSCLQSLRDNGSVAAPGFMDPEGVVVFHKPSGHVFKVTCENDEQPKGK